MKKLANREYELMRCLWDRKDASLDAIVEYMGIKESTTRRMIIDLTKEGYIKVSWKTKDEKPVRIFLPAISRVEYLKKYLTEKERFEIVCDYLALT